MKGGPVMKRDLFTVSIFILSLLLLGCNSDDYIFPIEDVVYSSDSVASRDSIETRTTEVGDSTMGRRDLQEGLYDSVFRSSEPATVNFSVSVLVNGDETVELGDGTKVTIKDIAVRVSGDSVASVYYPATSVDVAEPLEFKGWHNLPIGVATQKCQLFSDADRDVVKVSAGVNPTVSIRFIYIVRTWDSHLADGFSEVYNYYSIDIPFGFPVSGGSIYHIPLRICLTSVKFDAAVSSYE